MEQQPWAMQTAKLYVFINLSFYARLIADWKKFWMRLKHKSTKATFLMFTKPLIVQSKAVCLAVFGTREKNVLRWYSITRDSSRQKEEISLMMEFCTHNLVVCLLSCFCLFSCETTRQRKEAINCWYGPKRIGFHGEGDAFSSGNVQKLKKWKSNLKDPKRVFFWIFFNYDFH